ncbi:zinc finger SWIM domain-containing protein 7-like isoform X1 [Zingiber officinale]|uniref:zinc finger SWIM domain-containing protein 7-like isoform X1 n=1 Tax=Zingiber officinale TaxID=94328 RepID=UPI001C4C4AA6|nr:zinc finger SWIM domain-containing protein 7-like isoform X1 [Zingiber officinale]
MASSGTSIAVAEAVWEQIKSSRSASDDHLSILHFLFGKNLERATRIVDQGGVRKLSATPSRRSLFLVHSRALSFPPATEMLLLLLLLLLTTLGDGAFQVVGESRKKEEYICFPEHHCTCYSFFYDVVNRGEQLCCKHQIAARLAEAVGQLEEMEVSDEQLAVMLSKL